MYCCHVGFDTVLLNTDFEAVLHVFTDAKSANHTSQLHLEAGLWPGSIWACFLPQLA
jgi:hypothetical protein